MSQEIRGWVPASLWRRVKASVPIACVDIILADNRRGLLLGWRTIRPYANVWATPGGRIRMGEGLGTAANRILSLHGMSASHFYLVGVFPIKFPNRFDVSICLATGDFSGDPVPDGVEFKRIGWFRKIPNRTGKNYVRMIQKWRRVRRSASTLRLNQI